ncbi:MAG: hypothetical protein VYD19_05905, partial [Myxococcota bacterium]|nr:hypothetical protein [Myxococcota bacterium]
MGDIGTQNQESLRAPSDLELRLPQDQAIRSLHWSRSFIFRFISLYVIIVTLILFSVISGAHFYERRQIAKRFGTLLETVTKNTVSLLDGSLLASIKSNEDASGAAFKTLRAHLARIREQNQLDEDLIYILEPESEELYRFRVMLQEKTFIGDPYQPPPRL